MAAVRAIGAAAVVAYPVARDGADGMAARIAAPWIGPQQRRLPLLFPMVAGAEPRQAALHSAAAALAAEVAAGHAVVLLCEGDASLYASASYALLALAERHPACPVAVIPGITAVAAAAAAASSQGLPWPLALQQDALLIRPTPTAPRSWRPCCSEPAARAWCWPCSSLAIAGPGCVRCWRSGGCWPPVSLPRGWAGPTSCWRRRPRCPPTSSPTSPLLLIRQSWPAVLP